MRRAFGNAMAAMALLGSAAGLAPAGAADPAVLALPVQPWPAQAPARLRPTAPPWMACQGCDLRGADLRGLLLSGVDLRGADLRGADLRDAVVIQALSPGARLAGALLVGAQITGSDLVIGGPEDDLPPLPPVPAAPL